MKKSNGLIVPDSVEVLSCRILHAMLQNIIEYYWCGCIVIMIIVGIIIVRDEKENDILGKRLHKELWQFPITIEYKGRKLVIDRKEEYFKCGYFDCGFSERIPKKYTYFINNNPIACITEIKYTLRKHYFTTLNYHYNTSDFKDIVKEAIKEKRRLDKISFKEPSKDNRIKLYELGSQEDSSNGNG